MHRLIEFLRSVYVVVLFVVLECVAINFYAHSDLYTQAKMLSYSNRVVGGAQGAWGGVREYFGLHKRNRELVVRVAELENELAQYRHAKVDSLLWSASLVGDQSEESPYSYITSKVVSNTVNKQENFIILNRGERDGVHKNMAVISPGGFMVGYVAAVSARYSVAVSILNTKFRTSGKISGQEHMGSISWRGEDRYTVNVEELSKYAQIMVGDSVVSTGYSQIFPEGILIGRVVESHLNDAQTAYSIKVDLAADISSLSEVIIIANGSYGEIESLYREVE
ncbi:MAG: rod shape-determining protein MreC [Rikenellaceae bacterium]